MTTHTQSDALRVWGRAFFAEQERIFQERMQGMANYEAMYQEQKERADRYRAEAERLRAECEELRKAVAVLRELRAQDATLSAHLESVASERDDLRRRVMELERKVRGA